MMRGQKAIAGIRAEVAPLRERISRTEVAIAEIRANMVTKAEHAEMTAAITDLSAQVKRLSPNGGDSVDTGDLVLRIAQELGVADPRTAQSKRRRATDPPTRGR